KIMEYMAHGLPVITTPNPASADLVQDGGCGAVVPFGDVERVAAVLREWLGNRTKRTRLGAAGYGYARKRLDWSHDGAEFATTIERAAGDYNDIATVNVKRRKARGGSRH